MPTATQKQTSAAILLGLFPFLRWLKGYSVAHLQADFFAGLTVAFVLIPQSMAYAQLAGLPPYYGLYASFLPPVVAALFGSSAQLATGPVAIVSLMTATALEPLAAHGSPGFIQYAILLALMVGMFQFALGVLRLGLVVNLLSHPVVTGFTNAAALIIATSQLAAFLGVSVDSGRHHYETVVKVVMAALQYTHWPTLAMGTFALVLMLVLKQLAPRVPYVLVAALCTVVLSYLLGFECQKKITIGEIDSPAVQKGIRQYNAILSEIEAKGVERVRKAEDYSRAKAAYGAHSVEAARVQHELAILALQDEQMKEDARALRSQLRGFLFLSPATAQGPPRFILRTESDNENRAHGRIWRLKVGEGRLPEDALTMTAGGAVVGAIPKGLPSLRLPHLELSAVGHLASMAVIISLIGFMEAISIAKAMATRTGQRLNPNRELIGQGLANIVGAFTQSYPVSGSFSRSAVNLQAGAVTGFSSAFSSAMVVVTLLFFTPLLYYLPQSVLAAIIMMAVLGLINIRAFVYHWRVHQSDGAIAVITFFSTLILAPELDQGILVGVVLTIALFLLKNMKPEIAFLSKHPDGAYRSAERWGLETCDRIAVIRFNGSLFFASVNYLEEAILDRVASMPGVKHILIVSNGINEMDASGEEMLAKLVKRLREAGYDLSMSGVNDAVLDVMKRTGLYDRIGRDHFYPNVATAVDILCFSGEDCPRAADCPLKFVRFKKKAAPV